jgi:HSP20 family molecular chaperone IbpA
MCAKRATLGLANARTAPLQQVIGCDHAHERSIRSAVWFPASPRCPLAKRLARDATTSRGPYPPINLFQKGDSLVAIVELPGVSKNDLDIQAKENTIRIRGKKMINYDQSISLHRRERISGEFDRTLTISHSDRS